MVPYGFLRTSSRLITITMAIATATTSNPTIAPRLNVSKASGCYGQKCSVRWSMSETVRAKRKEPLHDEFMLISYQFISLNLRRLVHDLLEFHRGVDLRGEDVRQNNNKTGTISNLYKKKKKHLVLKHYHQPFRSYLFLIFISRASLRCGIIIIIN